MVCVSVPECVCVCGVSVCLCLCACVCVWLQRAVVAHDMRICASLCVPAHTHALLQGLYNFATHTLLFYRAFAFAQNTAPRNNMGVPLGSDRALCLCVRQPTDEVTRQDTCHLACPPLPSSQVAPIGPIQQHPDTESPPEANRTEEGLRRDRGPVLVHVRPSS